MAFQGCTAPLKYTTLNNHSDRVIMESHQCAECTLFLICKFSRSIFLFRGAATLIYYIFEQALKQNTLKPQSFGSTAGVRFMYYFINPKSVIWIT